MTVSDRALQSENRRKHEAACRELRKHLPSFLIVGEQLLIIRDAGIYLETHKSLEAFVEAEFGLERRRAYQYMESAAIKANLCTNGSQKAPILPDNERQFREIAKAPPEQQAAVVRLVAEKAAEENRKPTAKDYKQVVGELLLEGEGPNVEAPAPAPAAKPATPVATHHPKEMAGPLMAHVKTLTQMLNDLKKRTSERGGEWIDVQAISTQISALKYSLKSAIYYADCPACQGKGCGKCKQTGFLPELKSALVEDAK